MNPFAEQIRHSAQESVRFALSCLKPVGNHVRAKSSFVNPQGEVMHWHDFGDLEGPGWAANAVGGAHLLWRWGEFTADDALQEIALKLLDHVLEDGFIDPESGFISPYYELAQSRFCLNYRHQDNWLCPGSLAKIGVDLMEIAAEIPGTNRQEKALGAAAGLGAWLLAHVPLLESGWVPRRITRDGRAYPLNPEGDADRIFAHSADGLFLFELWAALSAQGLGEYRLPAVRLAEAFIDAGGMWGSINHDTYDDHENVAYACAFRIFRRTGERLDREDWVKFAYDVALPGLARYRMEDDRNAVATRGLLWMEESWDTAYLWENAEAAQAYLEAWQDTGVELHRRFAESILLGISRHHYGEMGFLTEGVDWNNHVGRQHHVDGALYGAINYTEPLLNNLHQVGPALALLASG